MAEIRIENLRKQFGSFAAVQDSSFTVHDGEFLALYAQDGSRARPVAVFVQG